MQQPLFTFSYPSLNRGLISFTYTITTTAPNQTVSVPMASGLDSLYDFDVEYGDASSGTVTAYADPDRTHEYVSVDTYEVRITGQFDYIRWLNDPTLLIEIKNFGGAGIGTLSFSGCSNFTSITAVDIPAIYDNNLASAFLNCSLFNGNVSNFDTTGVTSMVSMFSGCTVFNKAVNSFVTTSVTSMASLFFNCSAFNQSVSNWNTALVLNMSGMFQNCAAFNQALSTFTTTAVTNMSNMMRGMTLFNQDITGWNTGNVTTMLNMFGFGSIAFNQAIGSWNTIKVTTMTNMFNGATAFNKDVSPWNVGAVTQMLTMFNGATAFNNGGVALDWADTSKVVNFASTFLNCSAFNQAVSAFITTAATNMSSMFQGCSIFNQDVSGWNVSIVTTMLSMFRSCTAFNNGGVSLNWADTSKVLTMQGMFVSCTAFNQTIPINTIAVTTMEEMFQSCTAFNQALSFNTIAVTTMDSMFNGATAFDQDLSAFNITALTDATSMFLNVTLSTANYDALLTGWQGQTELTSVPFHGGNSTYTETSVDSGTTNVTTADKLEDTTQTDFLTTVTANDIAHNTDDVTFAKATAVDSNTVLSVSNDVFPTGKAYVIQSSAAAKSRFELSDTSSWTIIDGGAV